ncbi:alpha/beta-hydrolase [Linderina pennispora]|uniref:Alpha/beta-hydrolase n=1 Tax=Linderina pennispora TaxID=61395 RepID=A0A1Y1W4C9_9FUNG|nr:alpha/beta-hydrolase [Linderina pennispora]ORX68409.1 alpha/beta-hydrolase [Linderina pennispora]
MLNVTWHIDFPLSDGFVALHHQDREIVVSWAGTHRYRALLMDMAFFTLPYIEGESMNVHSGFLESVRGMIGPVKQHLEVLMDEFPDYMVVVTGHSKGGAEAALCALDLVRQISGLRQRLRVWTFGQPRVGDAAFAHYYNRILGGITFRVTGVADPVVALWIMNNDGDIYVAQNTTECEDPAGSQSVPFFLRTIQSHKDYLGLPPPDHADAEFSW